MVDVTEGDLFRTFLLRLAAGGLRQSRGDAPTRRSPKCSAVVKSAWTWKPARRSPRTHARALERVCPVISAVAERSRAVPHELDVDPWGRCYVCVAVLG